MKENTNISYKLMLGQLLKLNIIPEYLKKALSMVSDILIHDFVDVIAGLTEETYVVLQLNTK